MKILLIEGDASVRTALVNLLEANRCAIDLAEDGPSGLELATAVDYDLILLDVNSPQLDGISLCRQLRAMGCCKPILLLTTNNSDAEVVAGFDAGADDYISQPCAPDVLLARVQTWLRRSAALVAAQSAKGATSTLAWGNLCLELSSGRTLVGQQVVALTATEYNLLELFLRNPNRIFSRSAILNQLWGFNDAPTDRAIVTHVKDVRKKLKAAGLTDDIIETVYGMGYRLKPAPQSPSSSAGKPENPNPQQPLPQTGTTSRIDRVLERFRSVFNEQVVVLQQAATSLLAGSLETELQQSARLEAHKLAGSLASFGYPEGSKLARSLEHLLTSDDGWRPETRTRFSQLVIALQQQLSKPPVRSAQLSTLSGSTYRVLMIDDDAALAERLKAEADTWGFRMKFASSLVEARSRLSLHAPDVVLLDLSFPAAEEDGLSLLRELTEQSPDLPVIVFTGRGSLADRLAVSRLGARQFLHKPASTKQIFHAITRVLPKPQTLEAKVLIVDDDSGMLAVLSNLLTPWGIEAVQLNEPQQFWQVLVASSPNLVLLDLEMPQVSGLELCQVVRQDAQWGDLPILVVTAHTDAAALQQAFAAGADDFITKPVLGPELVTRVLSRLERPRAR